jgi:hypothetical protein
MHPLNGNLSHEACSALYDASPRAPGDTAGYHVSVTLDSMIPEAASGESLGRLKQQYAHQMFFIHGAAHCDVDVRRNRDTWKDGLP